MVEWSLNPLVAIGIALGVMFFGYFFGLFEGRSQRNKSRQKERAEEKDLQSAPITPPAAPPAPSDSIPILDLSMDIAGDLCLKLDGHLVDSSGLDHEQRKRLINILTQIRPWLEGFQPKAPSAALQSAPASTPQPAPEPASAPASQPTALQQDDDEQTQDAPPESIVAQIDSILQTRLAGTALAERGIHLQESHEEGVNVWVGPKKFDSVEDVDDDNIKAVIKAAIKEWENRYTPGL